MSVLTLDEGIRLGKLKGLELDFAKGQIEYLHFDGSGNRPDGLIPWSAVRSVGEDAITIESAAAVRQTLGAVERERLTSHVGDRPVLTETGIRVGTITNYEVDAQLGRIVNYEVSTGGFLGHLTGRHLTFPHAAIRTFGKDAIIVSDEVCREPEQKIAA